MCYLMLVCEWRMISLTKICVSLYMAKVGYEDYYYGSVIVYIMVLHAHGLKPFGQSTIAICLLGLVHDNCLGLIGTEGFALALSRTIKILWATVTSVLMVYKIHHPFNLEVGEDNRRL